MSTYFWNQHVSKPITYVFGNWYTHIFGKTLSFIIWLGNCRLPFCRILTSFNKLRNFDKNKNHLSIIYTLPCCQLFNDIVEVIHPEEKIFSYEYYDNKLYLMKSDTINSNICYEV